jgi:hypothetical protein
MGCGACGRGGRAPRTRGASGSRPCPLWGAAFSGWTGQAKGRRKPAWMAGESSRLCRKNGPGVEEVATAERREALPRASISRRSGRQAAACYCAPFGASLPRFLRGGGTPEPPTHVKEFAGGDGARPRGGAMTRPHKQLSSPGLTGRPSIPDCLRGAPCAQRAPLGYWVTRIRG